MMTFRPANQPRPLDVSNMPDGDLSALIERDIVWALGFCPDTFQTELDALRVKWGDTIAVNQSTGERTMVHDILWKALLEQWIVEAELLYGEDVLHEIEAHGEAALEPLRASMASFGAVPLVSREAASVQAHKGGTSGLCGIMNWPS